MMRKGFAFIALLFATSLFAQQGRVNATAVASAYQAISALDLAGQKAMFATLPSEMKGAIWRHQFAAYDAAHPELTAEQHRVIANSMFLIATGLYDAVYPDGRYALTAEIESMAAATRAAFSPQIAAAVFGHLGIPEAGAPAPSPNSGPYAYDCSCNIVYDFCNFGTGSSFCGRFPRCNTSSWGCGWAFAQACNGTCS